MEYQQQLATYGEPGVTTMVYTTPEAHGQSVKFSPFDGNRIAFAAGTDYGLAGQGHLRVLERKPETGQLEPIFATTYRDNFLDVCWSEVDPNVFVSSSGDGWLQLWNLSSKFPKVPIHEWKGHRREMSSVDWNLPKFSNMVLAASWDGTVSTYDTNSPWPLSKMVVSELIVYHAVWSPHSPNTYLCVSSDGIMQLWDLNANNSKPQIYLHGSETELLCCDWAKYTPNVVVTGGANALIKGWDLRNYNLPLFELGDHGHAVKRIKFSPFHPTLLASVSYDTTLRLFDYHASSINLEIVNQHSEFVYGLDWNLKYNELVTCSFDKTVKLCVPKCLQYPPAPSSGAV